MRFPKITTIIDTCCKAVSSPKGYDVNVAEGRAFTRQFFLQLAKMEPTVRQAFLEKYVRYYEAKKK